MKMSSVRRCASRVLTVVALVYFLLGMFTLIYIGISTASPEAVYPTKIVVSGALIWVTWSLGNKVSRMTENA